MVGARAHVLIEGLVQGVFFRESTRRVAYRERLSGWVRNLADGSVEAVFEGERPAVERAIAWCHHGPPDAAVQAVQLNWEIPRGEQGFRIHH